MERLSSLGRLGITKLPTQEVKEEPYIEEIKTTTVKVTKASIQDNIDRIDKQIAKLQEERDLHAKKLETFDSVCISVKSEL